MFNIGDKIVYASYGVMEVVDIREESFLDNSQKYYILESPGARSGSQTFVPVENEKLVSKMRPLILREELEKILSDFDSIPEADWISDNRARSENFKNVIESGDHVKMISMMKLVYATGKRREAEGKKNYLADQNAMQKAHKLLSSEFSTVLGIEESEASALIKIQ